MLPAKKSALGKSRWRTTVVWVVDAVAVVVCVLAYLLASGVHGARARDKPVRTLKVARLKTDETKGLDRKPEGLDAMRGIRHDDGSPRPLQRIDRGIAEFRRVGQALEHYPI